VVVFGILVALPLLICGGMDLVMLRQAPPTKLRATQSNSDTRKLALVAFMIIVRLFDLVLGLLASQGTTTGGGGFQELHSAAAILCWCLVGSLLTAERDDGQEGRHRPSLQYFVGCNAVFAAEQMRIQVMLHATGHLTQERLVLYGVALAGSFAMAIQIILLRDEAKSQRYSRLETSVDEEGSVSRLEKDTRREPETVTDTRMEDITWERVKRLMHYGLPEIGLLLGATVLIVIGTCFSAVNSLFYGILINKLLEADNQASGMKALNEYLELMIIMYCISAIFTFLGKMINVVIGQRIAKRLRNVIYSVILTQEVAFFDDIAPGELLNRITVDTPKMTRVVMQHMARWMVPLVTTVVAFYACFALNWRLTLVSLSLAPAGLAAAYVKGKVGQFLTVCHLDAQAKASADAEESLRNIRTVKSYGTEAREAGRYERDLFVSYDVTLLRAGVNACIGQYQGIVSNAAGLIAVYYGGKMMIDGTLSFGYYMAFQSFLGQALGGLKQLFMILPRFARALGASKRVFQLLDRERGVRFCGGMEIPADEYRGRLRFQNVYFAYPRRLDHWSLQGLSIDIAPGETHALVGASGAGKSTVLALCNALHYCTAGSLSLDGYELRDLDPVWYRRRVGYVPQVWV